MDIWLVAAAAGAGYVAQHCKKIVKGRPNLHSSACETTNLVIQEARDKKCSPFDTLYEKSPIEDVITVREPVFEDTPMKEIASSDMFNEENGNANCSTFSNSSSLPWSDHDSRGDQEGNRVGFYVDNMNGDLFSQRCTQEMAVSYVCAQMKSSLISRRTKTIKPLSSLESCLMAQLYKERAEIEDYAFSSAGLPSTTIVRPLLVTDESRIISRATSGYVDLPIVAMQTKTSSNSCSQDKSNLIGVPQLPVVGPKESQRKSSAKARMKGTGKFSNFSEAANENDRIFPGSTQGALLFSLGISIGAISSFLANKQEVKRLTDLLKQTENLIQDLQEELEMKDSLTVKELAVEDYEYQDIENEALNNGTQHQFSLQEKEDAYRNRHCDKKSEEESFGKIEAELEAELERLELNMNSCSLEGKLSNLPELYQDCQPTVVGAELKANGSCRQGVLQLYTDRNGSGSSSEHSGNYAVSPRKLSLRLHEVIQSRLEERVKELETALENSQMKVQYMESQRTRYLREFSGSESATFSTQGSHVLKQQTHPDQPVVINLSGNALDAYNEAYDELTRMDELEEEGAPSAVEKIHKEKSLQTYEENKCWLHDGEMNGNTPRKSDELAEQMGQQRRTLSNETITSLDDSENDHDELEELLIKHIVEKARQGSPVVLNAQRALIALDDRDS